MYCFAFQELTKLICFLVLLYGVSAQNCSSNRFGTPPNCFCTSDFFAVLDKIGADRSLASCAQGENPGTWTYNGNLDLKNANVALNTDLLIIMGNLIAHSNTVFSMTLDQRDQATSGRVDVRGAFTLGSSAVNLLVKNSNITTAITYTVGTWTVARLPTDTWSIGVPTVGSDFTICRQIRNAVVTPQDLTYTVQPTITAKPGWDCVTGRGNREGVVVFMVLLFIHAILVLVFCAVTCKIVSLKERIWDVDI